MPTVRARRTETRAAYPRPTDDEGSVTVFVAISVLGLLMLVGLIVDGGAKLRATQRADAVAAEAARAAGQMIDLPSAVAGDGARANVAEAVAAAARYLDMVGAGGQVTVSDDGQHILVTATLESPSVFLAVVGIPTLSVSGKAEVRLVHAASGGAP